MNKIVPLVLVIAAIAGLSLGGVLQTGGGYTYVFPRIESPGLQLVVSNISTASAVVRATFIEPDGTTLQSLRFTLSAGTQTIVDDRAAALGSFLGTAIIESTTPLSVAATTSVVGLLDTALPASGGSELIIPFARAGSIANTAVSVFNPGTQIANVLVGLGKANGTLVNGLRLTLGPRESRHFPVNSLPISAADLDAATYVIVRSLGSVLLPSRPVFAAGVVTNFDTGNGVVRYDSGIVHAASSVSLVSTSVVPLFFAGFGYFTQVQVVNGSDLPQAITLTALGADGTAIPAAGNPATVSVPARGSFSRDVLALFNLEPETVGFVSVSGGERLTAVGVVGLEGSPNLAVIDPAEPAASTFAFQLRSLSRDSFSTLAFLNSGSVESTASLTFVTNQGATISRAQVTVPAGNQVTRTLADILPEAEGSGFIFVTSSSPIQATALEGLTDGSVLSRLPALFVSTGFNPRPQERFLAVGTAKVAGIPIPGATVRLTGPLLATRISDSVGAFVYKDIPTGNYTVSIQMPGVTFAPSSVSFTITDQNQRDINFEGTINAPALTSITPSSVLVGTAAGLQVTVRGGPFIPTSEIVFDGITIPTAFTDESTLTGVVSASFFTLAREASVLVRNRVGPSFSASGTLPFVIGSPAPVITRLEGVPAQIIAGYPGFNVTVVGTGFAEGGTIQFNGVSRAYTFDSSTRVRAFISPEDLAVGRIATLTATNPAPTIGPSNATSVTVFNPVAGLISITPSLTEIKIEPNSTGLRLTVNGFLFKPGATVQVGGFPALNSTYVSETQLIADIPPSALENGGSFPVTVLNPPPNLGSSEVQPLTVQNLVPQLTSMDTGQALTFTPGLTEAVTVPVKYIGVLHGSNFGKRYAVAMQEPAGPWPSCNPPDGAPTRLSPQVISSTEIVVTMEIKCRGTFSIYVSSPQDEPGGGISQSVSFTVIAPVSGPVPVLSSLDPPSILARTAFTLTINGTNFLAGALVNFGTAILTPNPSDITATSIRVQVPAFYVEKGIIPVTVTNPGTGGTSTRLLFNVN